MKGNKLYNFLKLQDLENTFYTHIMRSGVSKHAIDDYVRTYQNKDSAIDNLSNYLYGMNTLVNWRIISMLWKEYLNYTQNEK